MKKWFGVLLAVALCAALFCVGADATGGTMTGGGTAENPYIVMDAADLDAVRDNLGAYYELGADIDLGGEEWTPIGSSGQPFTGTFDGDGHTISGLNVNSSYAGLFGFISGGTVKNLAVHGNVNGGSRAGGIVAETSDKASIENCSYSGSVISRSHAGGIAGYNGDSNISGCYNSASVSVETSSLGSSYCGGIAGYNDAWDADAKITDCYNTGKVHGTALGSGHNAYTGGIAGYSRGFTQMGEKAEIKNCYNTGAVSAETVYNAVAITGGIVGSGYDTTITGSYYLDTCGAAGSGNALSAGEFASQTSFSGWAFGTTWTISEALGRPELVSNPETGGGTKDDPFTIPSLNTLEYYRNKINSNKTYGDSKQYSYASANYELTANIDMSAKYHSGDGGESWTPIDNFTGTFDGNGYTISGLYINNTAGTYQGLFGALGRGGAIQNLTVSGTVTGGVYTGGIAGSNQGDIIDCVNRCEVTGSTFVGGIAGGNTGNQGEAAVQGCSNYGTITCTSAVGAISGGIVGANTDLTAQVGNCANYGTVTGASGTTFGYIGGITGANYGKVTGSVNEEGTRITGGEAYSIGGIVGYNYSEIYNCYNLGVLAMAEDTESAYVGGITGLSYLPPASPEEGRICKVENCYSYSANAVPYCESGTTVNCYYLADTETEEVNGATGKTAGQFASGEVAWLLQDGQDSGSGQVWGQTLSGDNKDGYPVLTNANRVYKVAFMEDSDTEFAAGYANSGGSVGLPTGAPDAPESQYFAGWFNQASGGTEYTSAVSVGSSDVTVYAQFADVTQETTPNIGIDYVNETLTGFAPGGSYTINGEAVTPGNDNTLEISDEWFGKALSIVKKGNGTSPSDSTAQSLTIPARPGAPDVGTAAETVDGRDDGQITGVTATMEYRAGSSGSWTPCAGSTVTGLADGEYQVRYKAAQGSSFAGAIQTVTIAKGAAPTYTLSVSAPEFESVRAGYEQPEAKPITITNTGNSTVTISSVSVDSTAFIVAGSGGEVTPGGSLSTYTVRPSSGLRAGNYTATVTVTSAEGTSATAEVSFEVTAEPVLPDPTYKPVVEEPEHGEVDVTPERPEAGDTVTVRPNPDDGYTVDGITVTDKDGNKVDITRNPDGSWSFTQPDGAVTITVTFGNGLPFTDVSAGQWFYDYVEYVYVNGLMNGTSATTFEPNANMTRAMVWAILARIDGETVTGESWQTVAREWAMANGVSDGTDPNGLVTREQFATMLWRYAGEPASSYSLASFTDANSVSDWAATAMAWAVEHGIITGVTNTTLVPQGSATRAQCAAMLMRFVEL